MLLRNPAAPAIGPQSSSRPAGPRRDARFRPASSRSPLLFRLLLLFLVALAVSRYDSTSLVFRGTEAVDFFNWFWRHRFFGFLSAFDVLLGMMLIAAAFAPRQRDGRADLLLPLWALLIPVSVLSRLANRTSVDTLQDFLFQLRDYLYLAGAYFVANRCPWTPSRYRTLVKLLLSLAALTIVLFFLEDLYLPAEHRLWKFGRFTTVRDVADFGFLLFAEFWLLAMAFDRTPVPRARRLFFFTVAAYGFYEALTGVGKAVLVVYPVYLVYLVWQYRLYRRRWFLPAAALAAFCGAAFIVFLAVARPAIEEGSPLYIYTTFTGEDFSVSTRLSEARNFFANLDRRKAWAAGIGLGTKWIEYLPQPEDLAAFPAQEQGLGAHLGVHVPLVRLALDFGLLGLALLLLLLWARWHRSTRLLRSRPWPPFLRAFVQASWLVIGYELMINNLGVPKGNLLVGILLGALNGLPRSLPARTGEERIRTPFATEPSSFRRRPA